MTEDVHISKVNFVNCNMGRSKIVVYFKPTLAHSYVFQSLGGGRQSRTLHKPLDFLRHNLFSYNLGRGYSCLEMDEKNALTCQLIMCVKFSLDM